ncbi:MAG: hypothetical protein V1867_06855 [Candidatus Falkowbacteria bacterium]
MELPSIKFNLFKKLEYYQILKQFDKRFDAQLELLKKSKWDNDSSRYKDNYPTWEIEKKILFWTYIRHKHWGRPIVKGHARDMFISTEELKRTAGIERIFENLEQEGFGKRAEKESRDGRKEPGCIITQDGLEFGELLWFLCYPKKYHLAANAKESKNYANIFRAEYQLDYSRWGNAIFWFQYISLYCFMVIAVALFILEFLEIAGLLDDLKNLVIILLWGNFRKIIALIVIMPFLFFCTSLIIDLLYRFYVHRWKYKLYINFSQKPREGISTIRETNQLIPKGSWKLISKFFQWIVNTIFITIIAGVLSSYIYVNWVDYEDTKKFTKNLQSELRFDINLAESYNSSSTEAQLPMYKAQFESGIHDSLWFLYQDKFSEETKKFVDNFYFGISAFGEDLDRLWLADTQHNTYQVNGLFNNLANKQNKIITHGKKTIELLNADLAKIKFCLFRKICF